MSKILMVRGSRTLASEKPDPRLRELIELVDIVIAGDAPGPDWWAGDFARECGKRFDMWCWRGKNNGVIKTRLPIGEEQKRLCENERFHSSFDRDLQMIRWCSSLMSDHLVGGAVYADTQSSVRIPRDICSEFKKHGIFHRVFSY